MNWKLILKSIGVAAATGAATATAQYFSTVGPNVNGTSLGVTAGIGALAGLVAYLTKSPLNTAAPVEK